MQNQLHSDSKPPPSSSTGALGSITSSSLGNKLLFPHKLFQQAAADAHIHLQLLADRTAQEVKCHWGLAARLDLPFSSCIRCALGAGPGSRQRIWRGGKGNSVHSSSVAYMPSEMQRWAARAALVRGAVRAAETAGFYSTAGELGPEKAGCLGYEIISPPVVLPQQVKC